MCLTAIVLFPLLNALVKYLLLHDLFDRADHVDALGHPHGVDARAVPAPWRLAHPAQQPARPAARPLLAAAGGAGALHHRALPRVAHRDNDGLLHGAADGGGALGADAGGAGGPPALGRRGVRFRRRGGDLPPRRRGRSLVVSASARRRPRLTQSSRFRPASSQATTTIAPPRSGRLSWRWWRPPAPGRSSGPGRRIRFTGQSSSASACSAAWAISESSRPTSTAARRWSAPFDYGQLIGGRGDRLPLVRPRSWTCGPGSARR